MNQARGFGVLLAFMLTGATPLSCAADLEGKDRICTLIGCGPTGSWRMPLDVPFEQIQASTLSVCKNGECTEIALAELEEPEAPGSGKGVSAAMKGLMITLWNDESSLVLEVQWQNPPSLADGDVYDLTLTDASGMAIATISETVDYVESYPNGPECDVTPCRRAVAR